MKVSDQRSPPGPRVWSLSATFLGTGSWCGVKPAATLRKDTGSRELGTLREQRRGSPVRTEARNTHVEGCVGVLMQTPSLPLLLPSTRADKGRATSAGPSLSGGAQTSSLKSMSRTARRLVNDTTRHPGTLLRDLKSPRHQKTTLQLRTVTDADQNSGGDGSALRAGIESFCHTPEANIMFHIDSSFIK